MLIFVPKSKTKYTHLFQQFQSVAGPYLHLTTLIFDKDSINARSPTPHSSKIIYPFLSLGPVPLSRNLFSDRLYVVVGWSL